MTSTWARSVGVLGLGLLAACGQAPSADLASDEPDLGCLNGSPVVAVEPKPPGPPPPPAAPPPPVQVPFALPPGPNAHLLLYDDQAVDVYAYPGAGRGMENVTLAAPGVFTFDRDGGIYTYDHLHATLIEEVATDSVAPYTFAPVRDRHGVVYFLATRDGARFRAGAGQAYCQWPGPEPWPAELNGVNECAGPRGGVTSLQVTARGDLAAFTTADGGVYLYLHASDHVLPLDPEVDSREAACCALSPDGRWVVWVTHAGEAWVMDRWRNETTLIPDLRAIALPGCPPRFTPYDPDHVYLMARPAGFGDVRMVAYDLRTAWIRGLVVLNLMAGM